MIIPAGNLNLAPGGLARLRGGLQSYVRERRYLEASQQRDVLG